MKTLIHEYGWSDHFGQAFAGYEPLGYVPGRVLVQQRGSYLVASPYGELRARLSGHLIHEAQQGAHPVAGDWVALRPRPGEREAIIQIVLPRRTAFVRKAAGEAQRPQVIAANIDLALLVCALTADFNLRRLERYLALAWQSGARPVIALTKADLCADPAAHVRQVESIAFGCPIFAVAAPLGEGVAELSAMLKPRETCVLLGSSGAGKSTLVNALAGRELLPTAIVSDRDGRGRHTTTHRQLLRLPGGLLVIDTPGMRELALLDAEDGLGSVFRDFEALEGECHFRNCGHGSEPGCAIRAALEAGTLDSDRWNSFRKLRKELAHLDRRDDRLAREAERKRWAAIAKSQRAWRKIRPKG